MDPQDPKLERHARSMAALYGGLCACEQARYLLSVHQYELQNEGWNAKRRGAGWADALRDSRFAPLLRPVYRFVKPLYHFAARVAKGAGRRLRSIAHRLRKFPRAKERRSP